jgi:hypothetical protein
MALTMINPASSWFEMVELPLVTQLWRETVNGKELLTANEIFHKTSNCIARLVNKTWLCRYPRCHYSIYNNGSEFKLHFEYLCKPYGIKRKPTTVFAGNVGFSNVKKMVKSTDTCVLARHVVDMLANMLATQPKTVSAKVLTMSSQHVAYGYVSNMSALQ